LTVRLQGTHLVHIFNYQRSQMVWLTFPLVIGRMSANCWVVTCWFSQMMASAHCTVTGLTTVTGWPEQGNHGHQLFLFQKQSFFMSSNQ
jgi:hypothetical protein